MAGAAGHRETGAVRDSAARDAGGRSDRVGQTDTRRAVAALRGAGPARDRGQQDQSRGSIGDRPENPLPPLARGVAFSVSRKTFSVIQGRYANILHESFQSVARANKWPPACIQGGDGG